MAGLVHESKRTSRIEPAFPSTPISEVMERYQRLNDYTKRQLTDYLNQFVGLVALAYGNDDQRRAIHDVCSAAAKRGQEPFGEPDAASSRVHRAVEWGKVNPESSDFQSNDLPHVRDIEQLVVFLNYHERYGSLTQDLGQKCYQYLIPCLYGKPAAERREATTGSV